jgi:hypothetical protein
MMRARFVPLIARWSGLRAPRQNGTRGQILPLYALGAVALLGMGTLAMDVGYWRYQQRLEQSAADSAATAGAIELLYSAANVTTFARNDATANGYTDGAADTTVQVNVPPATGLYSTSTHAVEVIVTKQQPLFFGGGSGITFLGIGGAQPVSARAVARNDAPEAGGECIIALGQLTINGGAGGFLLPHCGVIADGGMTINGNGTVTAEYIGVANGAIPGCGGCTEAAPARSIAAQDPCPVIASCEYLAAHGYGTPVQQTVVKGLSSYPPGEYTKTFTPGTATLQPGLYILDAGMTAKGSEVITATAGVTIYNKGGSISFGGNSYINLVPPASGIGAGIAIYQPPTNTSAVSISGGGTYGVSGMIYMPAGDLTLNGSDPHVSQLVVGSMTVNGGGITVDNTGTGSGPLGAGHVVLAE